jgi:hypothetical protein
MPACTLHPLAIHTIDQNASSIDVSPCACLDFEPWEDNKGLSQFDELLNMSINRSIAGTLQHLDYINNEISVNKNPRGCCDHPLAMHSFDRNASLSEDVYKCTCRGFTFGSSTVGETLCRLSTVDIDGALNSIVVHVDYLSLMNMKLRDEIEALKATLISLQNDDKM